MSRGESKLPASAHSKLDMHYLLISPREGSHVPVEDLPVKTGLELLDDVQGNQVRA